MKSRVFRAEVPRDLEEAAGWYEEQRRGLGSRFLEAIEETLDRIEENPRLYPVVHRDFRRALVSRPFPYQVFFRIEGRHLSVYAVLHMARDPAVWRRRL